MSIKPFNSVGGFSTGVSGFVVIDAAGGISGAGATFSSVYATTISAPNIVSSVAGLTGAVGITGAGAVLFTVSGKTGTFDARIASTSLTGVASFHTDDFTVGTTGHVRIKTGINATNIVVLGSGGTGGVGKLPAVDGSDLLEVNAKFLNGKTNTQITDGGTF